MTASILSFLAFLYLTVLAHLSIIYFFNIIFYLIRCNSASVGVSHKKLQNLRLYLFIFPLKYHMLLDLGDRLVNRLFVFSSRCFGTKW